QAALLAEVAAGLRGGVESATVAAPSLAARHGHGALAGLARRGLVEISLAVVERSPRAGRPPGRRGARPPGAQLLPEQSEALAAVETAIETRDTTPTLLDGTTGAGKTAVYASAIASALEAGGSALVLVPEIPQAMPLVDRLRHDLGAEVALLHSGLSTGERADEWRRIRAGAVDVVVGTRVAVLAPLADPRLIVVDEEHEATYKQERLPRYQARDLAIRLGALAGAAVVRGSAGPAPSRGPACRSPRIRYLGGGTERVEREVRLRFPDLRVGRLDRDVVAHRGAGQAVVDAFVEGRLDVLVGTSLVAKGLDV